MESGRIKRITKELCDLNDNPPSNYIASPIDGNIFKWRAILFPPEDSIYYGGKFRLDITFPSDYPFKPIKFRFATKMYHINVHEEGYFCWDYIQNDSWNPVKTLRRCLDSLYLLFTRIEEDNLVYSKMMDLYKTNQEQYKRNVKQYVKKYAMDK